MFRLYRTCQSDQYQCRTFSIRGRGCNLPICLPGRLDFTFHYGLRRNAGPATFGWRKPETHGAMSVLGCLNNEMNTVATVASHTRAAAPRSHVQPQDVYRGLLANIEQVIQGQRSAL